MTKCRNQPGHGQWPKQKNISRAMANDASKAVCLERGRVARAMIGLKERSSCCLRDLSASASEHDSSATVDLSPRRQRSWPRRQSRRNGARFLAPRTDRSPIGSIRWFNPQRPYPSPLVPGNSPANKRLEAFDRLGDRPRFHPRVRVVDGSALTFTPVLQQAPQALSFRHDLQRHPW